MKTLIFLPFLLFSTLYADNFCPTGEMLIDANGRTSTGWTSWNNQSISGSSDVDYFKIILTTRTELSVGVNNKTDGGKKTNLNILASDCSTSMASKSGKDYTLRKTLDAGTYYAKVSYNNGNTNYKIKAQLRHISDLKITKTVDNASVNVGDTVTFTLNATNSGPANSRVTITDAVPSGFTNVSASNNKSNFDCGVSGNDVSCTGDNSLSTSETFIVTITAKASTVGTYTNTANIVSIQEKSDPDLSNNSESVNVTISAAANQPPTANSQSITVDENSTGNTITLTGDDPDGNNSALTYTVVATPSHGTLNGTAPNLTYTPTAGYYGYDAFTFRVNDGIDDSSGAIVPITVTTPPDANATEITCGTFADMFQTHGTCSGSSGGTIHFASAGQLKDSSNNIILGNNDNSLNTCQVTVPPWVSNQFETCGTQGDCVGTESSGGTLNINYNNPPATATVTANPSASTDNLTLSADSTISDSEDNNITIGGGNTNINTVFDITNQLKINSLKMTQGNTFNFQSSNPYSLEIGTLGIQNNGADNTIITDDNAKNIKINTFDLTSGTHVGMTATQTIKMDNFTVGSGSDVTLKAQYVNINNFTSSNSGSGNSAIEIHADYIDISNLALGQTVTLKIYPYTSGKRVLFKVNDLNESSSSSIQLSSGNYYINSNLSIPGTSDISAMRAHDANQLINLFLNSGLTLGNNPGINALGNKGNYDTSLPAANFMMFINGDLTTGGGGTTINATIYLEGDATFGNPTYIKGAVNANHSIEVGQGQFTYDQNINDSGWEECIKPYCSSHNLTEGFHVIDPDGGDNKNSFEVFCHKGTNNIWHDLIALPIKNSSNNFLFNNNTTSSNYYDTTANPRTDFHAIEIDGGHITYNGTKPTIPVVTTRSDEPWQITTDGKNYHVLGSKFSNINLIGTPFKIDWSNSSPLEGCHESLLRKALGQAVKYNTINTSNGTSNDGQSRCKITTMNLTLLDDYQYLTYNSDEVLQHSCKEIASYVPNNILFDSSIAGHFNILTSEPAYPTGIPTTNGSRDNATDIGAAGRPLTVYCKYQTDLGYVWTFLTALDAKVTQSKNDLVSHQDTCSQLGLFFYVPNNKETFDRVRKYLKSNKNGNDGWENYTGTINEKIQAFHPNNQYYLTAFRDTIIWPYGPLGVYFPRNGNRDANGTTVDWGNGANSPKGYMSGSPLHNIKSLPNYNDSLGKKGWVSILGSQDLNKTNDWWIADIGAGEEIGNSSPQYSPHGSHPIQSAGYKYYEPNGNYTANAWLNFIFDSKGWIYHADDWNNNYPYYDYMCMSETNYDTASRYALVPGFFNAIERGTRPGNALPNFSDENITTKIVNKTIKLDLILYKLDPNTLSYDKTQLESDQNKSVGVFISSAEGNTTAHPVKFIGTYSDFVTSGGRIALPDINIASASKRMLIQFYYCSAADTNWTTCWNYNNNPNSPTISSLGGGDKSDSGDDFAVRPDKFTLTAPSGEDIELLTAAKDYNLSLVAEQYNNSTPSPNYTVNNANTELNITKTLYEENNTTNPLLKGTLSFSETDFNITDGSASNRVGIKFTDIGKVNIQLKDTTWAQVDIDNGDTPLDCSSTGAYICGDINATFIPDRFSLTHVTQHNHNDSSFTYISNDLNMSAHIGMTITALNYEGNATKNFTTNSWENPVNVNIDINTTGTPTLNRNDINSTQNIGFIDGNITIPWNETNSSKNIMFNFDRNTTIPHQPFKVLSNEVNITATSRFTAHVSGVTKDINSSIAPDKNTTFYYGRVHAPDQRFPDYNGTAKVYYEVYYDGSNKADFNITGDESIDSINWFTNTLHVDSDGNVSDYNSSDGVTFNGTGNDTLNNTANINHGIEDINLTTPIILGTHKLPHKDKINMTSNSWLHFSPTDFMVEFYGTGKWAGQGIQGKTVDLNISKRQNKRLDW